MVVVGGGPAGASAAIYSARKGLSVAVVAERIGGQVKETVGIENLISVPETTGTQLADNLRLHMRQYPIDLLEHRRIEKVTIEGNEKVLSTAGGEIFKAPAVIVATGASWRKLNVPGEAEYIGVEWLFVLIATVRFIRENMLPWLAVEIPVSRRLLIWRGSVRK